MSRPDIRVLIGVTRGDCSNTHALLEVLHRKGKGIMSFEYPRVRDRHSLQEQVEHLMDQFHVSWEPVMEMKRRLDRIRRKLVILDELTWKENRVSGEENLGISFLEAGMNVLRVCGGASSRLTRPVWIVCLYAVHSSVMAGSMAKYGTSSGIT